MAFATPQNGQAVFGVSGLLYNSDVLLYDHATESLWSQLLGQAISGPSAGETLAQIPLIHTRYGDWLARHPDTWVLSRKTGYRNIPYGRSPYPGYERSSRVWFPVAAAVPAFCCRTCRIRSPVLTRFPTAPRADRLRPVSLMTATAAR